MSIVSVSRPMGCGRCVRPAMRSGSNHRPESAADTQMRTTGRPAPPSQNRKSNCFSRPTLIVKVKEPLLSECHFFRPGQTLFTYLHLASLPDLTKALLETKITAIAYETIEAKDGTLADAQADERNRRADVGADRRAVFGEDARRARASLGRCAGCRAGEGRRAWGWGGRQRGDSDCRRDGGSGDGDQSRP